MAVRLVPYPNGGFYEEKKSDGLEKENAQSHEGGTLTDGICI